MNIFYRPLPLFFALLIASSVLMFIGNMIFGIFFAYHEIQFYVFALIIAICGALVVDAINSGSIKKIVLILGMSFLYLPMLMLIIYSFNEGKSVAIWTGFSFKWYHALVSNSSLLKAVSWSLLIAACSATGAVILGTLASIVIVRFGKFRGANLFSFITAAPLVMPDVITAFGLLLLFKIMTSIIGWPQEKGFMTICLAHITFCTAYVIVVISSRLRELDKSIEEAAMDLGANPFKVFFVITLKMILPSIFSGWLLAFTLSLDDYVISEFTRGSLKTLPIEVFAKVKLGVSPDVNALATVIILIVSIIGFIAWLSMRKTEKRKMKEFRNH